MKTLTLTHNTTSKDVVVNWDKVLFLADTETNLGDNYCEIAFAQGQALPVKQSASEICELINAPE